ncbi:MAG: sigma-70 family RNA polymerase sigma factor [Phycisphaerales bacterium]|nr:MAG: sigma-70 family RNA polymerase sigma factor [Phycisphaerales bacterium]
MSSEELKPVTRVLQAAAHGDVEAASHLLPQVYEELRKSARARLKKVPAGNTLQATALVHEAYLRVVGEADPGWDNRGHFFAAAAQAMRDILVEQARRKASIKHGGDRRRVSESPVDPAVDPPSEELLAVDEALRLLEQHDPRKGRIANLRFFARMTTAETAAALGISVGTVGREWRYIRTWLECQLRADESPQK